MNQIEFAISAILKTSLHQSEKGQAILAVLSIEQPATKAPQFTKNPAQDGFIYLVKNNDGYIRIVFTKTQENMMGLGENILGKFTGTKQNKEGLQFVFKDKFIGNELFNLNESEIKEIQDYFLKGKDVKKTVVYYGRMPFFNGLKWQSKK